MQRRSFLGMGVGIVGIISEDRFKFASFRDDSVPVGLISIRCKQLAAELSISEE